MDEARQVLGEEEPKQRARERLRAAQDSGDAGRLRAAIVDGHRAGLDSSELIFFEDLLAEGEARPVTTGLKYVIRQAMEAFRMGEEARGRPTPHHDARCVET